MAFFSSSAFSASLHTIGGMDEVSILEHSFWAIASHTFERPASHSAAGTLFCLEQAAATNFFSRSGFSTILQICSGIASTWGHSFWAKVSHIFVRNASHSVAGTFCCFEQSASMAFFSSSVFSASLHTIGGMDEVSLL